jgi:hypothetical protein
MPNEFIKKQTEKNQEDNRWSERCKELTQKAQEATARNKEIVSEAVKQILENRDPEFIKKIIRDVSQQILDQFIEMKLCPLLTNFKWTNCGEQEKGKEPFCSGGKFVNCPAFDRYITHEIIARPQRKKKQKRKDKEDSRKSSK